MERDKHLANIYLFKFNDRNTRKRCEMGSKLTIYFTPFSSLSIVDLEQVNASWGWNNKRFRNFSTKFTVNPSLSRSG